MKIKLGNKVEDVITGFHGTAVARAEYLNGCVRFGVQPTVVQEGKLPNWQWIDETQLRVTETKQTPATLAPTGGPAEAPPRF